MVKVTSPKAKSRIESPNAVTIAGTAKSQNGIAGVFYQVLRNGVVSEIRTALGTTSWTADLALNPAAGGLYTVFVKAVDGAGGESDLVAFQFTYVAPAP